MDPFLLEEYFAKHEFAAEYLLCCSDTETIPMSQLLDLADDECRQLWNTCSLGYTETSGSPHLKQEIRNVFYPALDTTSIHCFCGAEEAIYSTLRSVLSPGDNVICFTPIYQSLYTISKTIISPQGQVFSIDLDASQNWSISVKQIQSILASTRIKLLIMNFPHNPTGTTISAETQHAIIDVCREYNVILFSDEVYMGLNISDPNVQDSSQSQALLPAACLYENAISLGVLSKSIGLAGLRIGWICTQNKILLQNSANYKHYLSICNSAPSEILGIIALRNYKTLVHRSCELIRSNLILVDAFMCKYSHLFDWVRPKGGCIGFVRYKKQENSTSLNLDDLCCTLVNEYGVLLLPGCNYIGSNSTYNDYFRFGFGRATLPEALRKFELALAIIFPDEFGEQAEEEIVSREGERKRKLA